MAAGSDVVMFGLSIPSFLATGIWALGVFFFVAVVYLTHRLVSLIAQSLRLRRQLVSILYDHPISVATVEELDVAFASTPAYQERWRQVRRSLAVFEPETGGTSLASATPPRQAFNPQEILAAWVNMRIIDTVPSILSSMGLLLTFLAILSGLNGAIVSSSSTSTAESLLEFERMRVGIVHLVSNLSGKFLASVCALGASALFVVYERIVVGISLATIASIRRVIDENVEFQSSDRVLREIQTAVLDSVNRSRIVSAHIPQYIRNEVHNAAGMTLERIESMMQQLCAVAADFRNQPSGSIEIVERPGLSAHSAAAEDAHNRLLRGVSEQVKAVSAALSSSTESLQQISAALSGSTGKMVAASEAIDDSLRQHASQSKEQLAGILKTLEGVGSRMQESVVRTSRSLSESLEKVSAGVEVSVNAAAATFAQMVERSPREQSTSTPANDALPLVLERTEAVLIELEKAVAHVGEAGAAFSDNAASFERGAEVIERALASTGRLFEQGEALVLQSQKVIDRNSEQFEQLLSIGPVLEQSMGRLMARSQEQFGQVQHDAVAGIREQVAQAVSISSETLSAPLESIVHSLDQLKGVFAKSITETNQGGGTSESAIQSYLEKSEESRQRAISLLELVGGRFEGALVNAVGSIISTVEESSAHLQESVAQLALTMSAVANRETAQAATGNGARGSTRDPVEAEYSQVLKASAAAMEQGAEVLTQVLEGARAVIAQSDQVAERSRSLIDYHGQSLELQEGLFKKLDNTIAGIVQRLDKQVWQYNKEILEALKDQVTSGAVEQLSDISLLIEGAGNSLRGIPQLLAESCAQIANASATFGDSLIQRVEATGSQLERSINVFEAVGNRMQRIVTDSSESVRRAVGDSVGKFEGVVAKAASAFSAIADRERSGAEAVIVASTSLEKTAGQLVSSLSGFGPAVEAFARVKSGLDESSRAIGEGTAALRVVITATQQLQEREEGITEQTRALFTQNVEALKGYHEVFSTLDQSIAKIMSQLEEQIWRFQSRIQEQFHGTLERYDELSARGLVTFESAITNLSDILIDHRDSGGSHNGFPGGSHGPRGDSR